MAAEKTTEDLSIQRRVESKKITESSVGFSWFVSELDDEISPWWSEQRDRDLGFFWMKEGNDILQGAVSSMVKKFKAMNWVIEGPEKVVETYQPVLAEAEFGAGWGTLLGKTLTDHLTKDKGAFWELIGEGPTDGPIVGPVQGVAHLDSALCQLTGDPVYPVLFRNSKDDKSHRLHATRVVHLVDMPSPREIMYNVGFSAVSRTIASSQILLRLARYKNEKLSDLPEAGLLILNNVLPTQWDDVKANYKKDRRRLGQEFWKSILTLMGFDPAFPVTAELISFSNLPDAFNERESTDIYVNIVALAFGVDVREFWPLSTGTLGTATETAIQHQKARGKGVGDVISTLERAINWKILPTSVSFRFDFRDDEEDKQQAEIIDLRTKTIMSMWDPPRQAAQIDAGLTSPVSRLEIRQMLADNVAYFKEDFLAVDISQEVEATDTEREKALGRPVGIDAKGKIRPIMKRHKGDIDSEIDALLTRAEKNYQRGDITLDDLIEFRLGDMMDRRLGE